MKVINTLTNIVMFFVFTSISMQLLPFLITQEHYDSMHYLPTSYQAKKNKLASDQAKVHHFFYVAVMINNQPHIMRWQDYQAALKKTKDSVTFAPDNTDKAANKANKANKAENKRHYVQHKVAKQFNQQRVNNPENQSVKLYLPSIKTRFKLNQIEHAIITPVEGIYHLIVAKDDYTFFSTYQVIQGEVIPLKFRFTGAFLVMYALFSGIFLTYLLAFFIKKWRLKKQAYQVAS